MSGCRVPGVLAGFFAATLACAGPPAARPLVQAVEATGDLAFTASFRNFNSDPLQLRFVVPRRAVQEAMAEYGYTPADTEKLKTACGGPCSQAQFDRHVQDYYRSRGVAADRTGPGNMKLRVDIPAVVRRNRARVKSLAASLDRLGSLRAYDAEQTIGAAVSLVQTALEYRRPPKQENGRNILGFYPPPRALEAGWGDCDTKSALLAAVVANFPGTRMVGVHVPGHYLVGIARVPRHGDAFVDYDGQPYVLIEPAGPGWLPPGMIGEVAQAALATMNGVRIDPLF